LLELSAAVVSLMAPVLSLRMLLVSALELRGASVSCGVEVIPEVS
jgi:hypothetical protein